MSAVGTRDLVLIVDGTDHSAAILTAVIRSAASGKTFVSFAAAAAGGAREYHLTMALYQDVSGLSLWTVVWSRFAEDVPFELWPMGRPDDGVPTADQPRSVGIATVADPDGDFLGGTADPDPQARMTTEVEWLCEDKPVLETS